MPKKPQPLLTSPRTDLEFSLHLERRSGVALHTQLTSQLRDAIRCGQLEAGRRIPSSRRLAAILNVDRNMVVIAFETLLSEGYLVAKSGSGTFVTTEGATTQTTSNPVPRATHRWQSRSVAEVQTGPTPRADTITFALGQPSVAELEIKAWRDAWRGVATEAPFGDYADPQGHPELRAAIAQYLGRARGLRCAAEDVIVTNGTTQAVQLIARATLGPRDTVAMEDPGYRLVRALLEASGVRLIGVPVDHDGLEVDRLPVGRDAPLLVYCTPSHQYPLGSRLPIPRRLALLAWARTHDALILEDDYDSEFRFETAPLPALAALGQDCTVYLGTFSKTITPSLRVGYIVAPRALRDELVRVKTLSDYHTSLPVQIALTRFILQGHFERHIRRMRRVYAAKRHALVESLEPIQHLAPLKGLEAGLHAHLELPETVAANHVVARAEKHGIVVSTLESYAVQRPVVNGLLLGYGGLSLEEIRSGASTLARIILETA
jgi:GntR family transcriptional regulator / MocR family aminotransferase